MAGVAVPRVSADDRLRRLLALVPWVAAHDGPTVEEVCARFGCTEQDLVEDLELLFVCGLYPYTPDVLIETDIADGRVKRSPVKDYLLRQGRFAHFTNDDLDYFQSKIDEMWDKWVIPGVIPFRKQIDEDRPPSA